MGAYELVAAHITALACEEYGWTEDEIKAIDPFNGIVWVTVRPRKSPKHLLLTVIVQEEDNREDT